MTSWILLKWIFTLAIILILSAVNGLAVPPDPDAAEKWKADGTFDARINIWKDYLKHSGLSVEDRAPLNLLDAKQRYRVAQADGVDTVRLAVILVEFTDHLASGQAVSGTAAQFDSILFSAGNVNPTGSMTDYYLENSYGAFFVTGDVYGWYTMPQTYSWYVSNDYGLSSGSRLAYDAVTIANDSINFADYDYDNDGYCDGLIIIHAGLGAEQGGNDIWSHRGWVYSTPNYDGIIIRDYTLNPEEFASVYDGRTVLSPIGVFCHEFGHVLGLPDLYDVNYTNNTSEGLGGWSMMAGGSYNGGAKTPAHFDAWSKIFLGFVDPIIVESNLRQAAIPRAESNPVVYALRENPDNFTEYWLVENRRRIGFDSTLPGEGLLIYHVDNNATFSNSDPNRYHVALEQADGRNSLAFGGSRGDNGDPWPGSTDNRNFHDLTVPNSRTNIFEDITEVGVWNISDPGDVMYADLDVSFSRPYILLDGEDSIRFVDTINGNNNGLVEQGETIELFIKLKNHMLEVGYGWVNLSVSSPEILILQNDIRLSTALNWDLQVHNSDNPLVFTVPADFDTRDVTFTLALTVDSSQTGGSGLYRDTIEFVETVGQTEYLVVNSGHSEALNSDAVYKTTFNNLGQSVRVWDRSRTFPDTVFLQNFKTVFWITDTSSTDIFEYSDIKALKSFLDKGNNLIMSSPHGLDELLSIDPFFVSDYLHLDLLSINGSSFTLYGITGNEVGDGIQFFLKTSLVFNGVHRLLAPVNGGREAFELNPNWGGGTVGISYSGTYKTLFLTFPVETIMDDKEPDFDTKATLLSRIVKFTGGDITAVEDEESGSTLPRNFTLYQNYPNPFNPTTIIKYTLNGQSPAGGKANRTRLAVYNLLGREVKVLIDEVQPAGTYEVNWDATDRNGQTVATGVYFYKLERGDLYETRKMVLLK